MLNLKERTLIILKPDALQRGILGPILERFHQKGLKLVGLKMTKLSDVLINTHYKHHRDKVFFSGLKRFMQSAPVALVALEGLEAVEVVRNLVGPTSGRKAPAGTIRGDFSISTQANIIHASDSVATAKIELKRFFKTSELFSYDRHDFDFVYGEEERGVL